MEWGEVLGANAYEVSVQRNAKPVKQESVRDTQFRLQQFKPGNWSWKVRATGQDQDPSPWSLSHSFSILDTVDLSWTRPREGKIVYEESKPTVLLAWQPGPKGTATYRMRYAKVGGSLDKANWKRTSGSKVRLTMPAPGNYQFEAQALSQSAKVLGKTSVKLVQIEPSPPLPAPQLQTKGPNGNLLAKPDGSLSLKWGQTKGATKYQLVLTEKKSGKTKKITTKLNRHKFSDLLPGAYQLQIGAINSRDEVGELSVRSTIKVPAKSNIAPPAAFDVKVH